MKYDIIIPHYGVNPMLTALVQNCLHSIRRYSQDYRVILVDNGSPDLHAVKEELARHVHTKLISNTQNKGFVAAANQGFLLASADYVVLMNNDTEAVQGWLEGMRAGFRLAPNVAAVGPRTTTKHSWQGRNTWFGPPRLLPATGMLAFFCTMFRRDVLDKVGLLDEQTFGVGLGDDSDYCQRLHLAGWRLAFAPDVVIPHHHRSTFKAVYGKEEVAAMQVEALRRFRKKWPQA